ncbi:MAG: ATPase [Helicobacteraceae bacterium]|nr:ATPase [Helicobacteraceae bacterium]
MNNKYLELYKAFYKVSNPNNLEEAIEYFGVFGGLDEELDTDVHILDLIEENILDNYKHFHARIMEVTNGDALYHSLLSGLSTGDRRLHSAYKRSKMSEDVGSDVINFLVQNDMITLENSTALIKQRSGEKHSLSEKALFTSPFLRFWFSFVSPLFKGVSIGNYGEVDTRFSNRRSEFIDLTFELLSRELLKLSFAEDDEIVEIGSYWDAEMEIAIVAKTKSGKTIVAECKYTSSKMKKTELTKLQSKCELLGFEPDIYALFSKSGFTNELKGMKGEKLKLFSLKNFKKLSE